jgi:transporter family protein
MNREAFLLRRRKMGWMSYAVGAAVLYGMHQVFTKMASSGMGDGIGGFIVEATAAATIGLYLLWLKVGGRWDQPVSGHGILYSVLTGVCVGVGTLFFFLLFQKGGPLSAVPMILAGGAALMAIAGFVFFKEPMYAPRLLGIVLSLVGLYLLKFTPQ